MLSDLSALPRAESKPLVRCMPVSKLPTMPGCTTASLASVGEPLFVRPTRLPSPPHTVLSACQPKSLPVQGLLVSSSTTATPSTRCSTSASATPSNSCNISTTSSTTTTPTTSCSDISGTTFFAASSASSCASTASSTSNSNLPAGNSRQASACACSSSNSSKASLKARHKQAAKSSKARPVLQSRPAWNTCFSKGSSKSQTSSSSSSSKASRLNASRIRAGRHSKTPMHQAQKQAPSSSAPQRTPVGTMVNGIQIPALRMDCVRVKQAADAKEAEEAQACMQRASLKCRACFTTRL
ncbi:hypothetical protein DUNSADRAFT_6923 [Dunaliella salina]|uniref:Encoded protein n=1 Tax=Dunaliella salina TaxID=3046 RepID=A0ABQ7GMA4_DUNSA|nr:hypothetical protein DUNSADRAFT_6923 [Dunaliella salina]|eukprot:KAF5835742.1 hypothetical protein DUNSADRAFT_6923 [Dunaliella salina]